MKQPVAYLEVKVLKISDKETARFGLGFAKSGYPHLRVVGGKDSIGLRGDGKVFCSDTEDKSISNAFDPVISTNQYDFTLEGSILGCGYEFRTNKVFFTVNGKEVTIVN